MKVTQQNCKFNRSDRLAPCTLRVKKRNGQCGYPLKKDLTEQEAYQGSAVKYLPDKSHREVAGNGLEPYRKEMDPGMFEDKSGPETHDRAHKGNGYTGSYGSDQQGIILSRNRHFKSNRIVSFLRNIL